MSALSGLRVLVVEDDKELRILTQMLLEDEGAEVRCAATGHEALELLATRFMPNVAVLDARLPDTSGKELGLQLSRLLPACSQVLVSGDSNGLADWEKSGGLALSKPFEIDDLLRLVTLAASIER